jgi:hypothetical protein
MRNVLVVFAAVLLVGLAATLAHAGERVVCKVWLDDGGIVARSTAPNPGDVLTGRADTAGLALATLDGYRCDPSRLQSDGGIVSSDGGLTLTNAAGTANSDGGYAGCAFCDFRGATSIVMQCRDSSAGIKVYYSEKWDGGSDSWGQRGVVPATSNDELVDFSANPDGYRINLRGRGIQNANQHMSVKPVTASASAYCTFATHQPSSP